ncbi:MAG TPA: hypothetical protein VJ770_05130 [Stellaceae bacterium]|nr:hypothetical protein [Stellaceae bacterium]
MLAIAYVALVLAGATLPAYIASRPPNGCDPGRDRAAPARLALACLARLTAG